MGTDPMANVNHKILLIASDSFYSLIQINIKHHEGLEWIDAEKQIARIPWPRARG